MIIQILVQVLFNLFSTLVFCQYIKVRFSGSYLCRFRNYLSFIPAILASAFITIYFPMLTGRILACMIILMLSFFLCKVKFSRFISTSLILFGINILSELLSILIVKLLSRRGFAINIYDLFFQSCDQYYQAEIFCIDLLSGLFTALSVYLIYKSWHRNSIKRLRKINVFIMSVIIVDLMGIFLVCNKMLSDYGKNVNLRMFLGMMLQYLVIIIYYLYVCVDELFRQNLEDRLLLQAAQFEHEYYDQLEKNQQVIRELRHNIKNQLIIVNHYMGNGDYEKAGTELQKIMNSVVESNSRMYTRNAVVNSILNAKLGNSNVNGTSVSVDVKLPQKLNIAAIDLAIIFGNLLDNAIEACQKLKPSVRMLSVQAGVYENLMVIEIINRMQEESLQGDNTYLTTKNDSVNHGIGLKSVKRIVDKYKGTMTTIAKEYYFQIQIMLVIKKQT